VCTTTSTPTPPTNVKSSELCEMGESADAQSAMIGAMAEEEEEVVDDGKTVAFARDGVTALARTAGRTSRVREAGGTSLVRTVPTATQASLLCCLHRGGTKTNTKMMGLGASKSRVQLLASWVAPRPQPHSAYSSSLLVR